MADNLYVTFDMRLSTRRNETGYTQLYKINIFAISTKE